MSQHEGRAVKRLHKVLCQVPKGTRHSIVRSAQPQDYSLLISFLQAMRQDTHQGEKAGARSRSHLEKDWQLHLSGEAGKERVTCHGKATSRDLSSLFPSLISFLLALTKKNDVVPTEKSHGLPTANRRGWQVRSALRGPCPWPTPGLVLLGFDPLPGVPQSSISLKPNSPGCVSMQFAVDELQLKRAHSNMI